MFLWYNASLRYKESEGKILSLNLLSTLFDSKKIDDKLNNDLIVRRISQVLSSSLFVCSSFRLVPKGECRFWKIHNLFFPPSFFVNDCMPKKAVQFRYTTLNNLVRKVVAAERPSVIIKRDIKDAICNIFVVPNVWWLLRFYWGACLYTENYLFFKLRPSSFIFNLIADAFYWFLQSFLSRDLGHHLDNFVTLQPKAEVTPGRIRIERNNYARLKNILGIPQKDTIDLEGTLVLVLGMVYTRFFMARLPRYKLQKASEY